mgnify:CR=1 FL=1
MRVKVIRSPDPKKKFRAILENGKTVDFGARGYSDYTKHKTPSRMRSYISRHGGQIPKRILAEKDPNTIHNMMLNVNRSDKEDWKLSGINGAGFWSRWYLWSFPDVKGVKTFMKKRFNLNLVWEILFFWKM